MKCVAFINSVVLLKGHYVVSQKKVKQKKLHIYFINDVLKQNQKTESYAITE